MSPHGLRRPRDLAPVRFADQLEDSARALGVLKSSASASRNALDGGLPGTDSPEPPRCCSGESPPASRPTGCSRKKFRSRSTCATACSICSAPERQRLPVVPRDQVSDDRLAPIPVERLARAGRCCPRISTSSRPRSRPSRCASRSGRTAAPPPPTGRSRSRGGGRRGRSRRRGSRSSRPAPARPSPSTRCARRAGPGPRASPSWCPRPPCAPSRARSRARFSLSERRAGLLALVHVLGVGGWRACRSRRSCGPGSRRRRRTRRRGRPRPARRSGRRCRRSSRSPAARRRAGRARAGRCPRSRRAVIRAANSAEGSPAAAPRCRSCR